MKQGLVRFPKQIMLQKTSYLQWNKVWLDFQNKFCSKKRVRSLEARFGKVSIINYDPKNKFAPMKQGLVRFPKRITLLKKQVSFNEVWLGFQNKKRSQKQVSSYEARFG